MEPQGNNTTPMPQEQVATKLEAQSTPKRGLSTLDITVMGTSFVVFILLIVGIAVDKLNTGDQKTYYWDDQRGITIYVKRDFECKWKESGSKVEGGNGWHWTTYDKACDNDDSGKACDVETAGQVWLAFGILGIVTQAAVLGSMIALVVVFTSDKFTTMEAMFRLAALGIACAFVVIQWSVWKAKGCSDVSNDYDMGVSMILVIIAWALNVVATGLQAVNTVAIMRDNSSGSPDKQADLEDGANIRS